MLLRITKLGYHALAQLWIRFGAVCLHFMDLGFKVKGFGLYGYDILRYIAVSQYWTLSHPPPTPRWLN